MGRMSLGGSIARNKPHPTHPIKFLLMNLVMGIINMEILQLIAALCAIHSPVNSEAMLNSVSKVQSACQQRLAVCMNRQEQVEQDTESPEDLLQDCVSAKK
jgi:hypothetical protein